MGANCPLALAKSIYYVLYNLWSVLVCPSNAFLTAIILYIAIVHSPIKSTIPSTLP